MVSLLPLLCLLKTKLFAPKVSYHLSSLYPGELKYHPRGFRSVRMAKAQSIRLFPDCSIRSSHNLTTFLDLKRAIIIVDKRLKKESFVVFTDTWSAYQLVIIYHLTKVAMSTTFIFPTCHIDRRLQQYLTREAIIWFQSPGIPHP